MTTNASLRAALNGLTDEHLGCRDLGHGWAVQAYYRKGNSRTVTRVLQCFRCYTKRTDQWTTQGERGRSRYDHAADYLVQGFGRIAPVDVRVAVLRRVKTYQTLDEMIDG